MRVVDWLGVAHAPRLLLFFGGCEVAWGGRPSCCFCILSPDGLRIRSLTKVNDL